MWFLLAMNAIHFTAGSKSEWVKVGSKIQCEIEAVDPHPMAGSRVGTGNLTACQKSCENNAKCKSITLFKSGWCSRFSSNCLKTKSAQEATSMRLLRVTTKAPMTTTKPPMNAGTKSKWAEVGSTQCDTDAGEVLLSGSRVGTGNLTACQKSCEDDAKCKSITLFKSGWCSRFSSECTKTKSAQEATSMRLLRVMATKAPTTTTKAPTTTAKAPTTTAKPPTTTAKAPTTTDGISRHDTLRNFKKEDDLGKACPSEGLFIGTRADCEKAAKFLKFEGGVNAETRRVAPFGCFYDGKNRAFFNENECGSKKPHAMYGSICWKKGSSKKTQAATDGSKCNACTCDNGEPAMGAACPKDGSRKCIACSGKFFLDGQSCKAHRDCKELDKLQTKAGTNTSDAECSPCSPAEHESAGTGYFLFTPACVPVRCSNAMAGEFYTGPGTPNPLANVTGNCGRSACNPQLLRADQFFTVAWADTRSACANLVADCPLRNNTPPGYRFDPTRVGMCKLVKCDSPSPGRFFDGHKGACSTSPCAGPPAGRRFVPGWTDQATRCPTERCPQGPRGTYFVNGCSSANCTQAPAGFYYLFNGGTKDACPVASCTNARIGQGYTRGHAVAPDKCPTKSCGAKPAPGYYFATPGVCAASKCRNGRRGTYFTSGCSLGNCTNGNSSTYYIPSLNTDPDKCAVKNCGQPPPPGVLFSNATGCATVVCTNAQAGYYYVPVDQERASYLQHMRCPTASCHAKHVPGAPVRRFVRGFATAPDSCPTERCDARRLSAGHYFRPFSKCSTASCEPVVGLFYLAGAEGGKAGCARVQARCENAVPGYEYAASPTIVVSPRGCEVRKCAPPPVGHYHAYGGDCTAIARCSVAEIGHYYVASNASCRARACANAKAGQFYTPGTVEHWQNRAACPVRHCSLVQGYRHVGAGTCSQLRRCRTPPAGYYYGHPKQHACEPSECDDADRTERHYRFVPAFALRKDWCAKRACDGDAPHRYASPDSCEPHANDTSTSTTSLRPDERRNVAEAWPLILVCIVATAVVVVALCSVVVAMWVGRRGQAHGNPGEEQQQEEEQEEDDDSDDGQPMEEAPAELVSEGVRKRIVSAAFLLRSDEVVLGQMIARGGAGRIFSGQFGDQAVALKENLVASAQEELARESAMMTKLRHPNVVQFFGIWQSPQEERVFLVMEMCDEGDLKDAANAGESSLAERQTWILQVASAMRYLHSRTPPVVHRDLKPRNVLLDAQRNAKVCDFGCSKNVERDMTAGVGTVAYMAPELMAAFSEAENGPAAAAEPTRCDVFSFAVLALYVATGAPPHQGLTNEQIFVKVAVAKQRTDIVQGFAGEDEYAEADDSAYDRFVELVREMWRHEPEGRPAFSEIEDRLANIFNISMPPANVSVSMAHDDV